ncbi:MAG: hypothetical protein AAGF66_09880 [Cyanobacteria bacterium P01_H01_bin.119]
MAFVRSYVIPFLIVLVFGAAMLAVSARSFLPGDMMSPAPVEMPDAAADSSTAQSSTAVE